MDVLQLILSLLGGAVIALGLALMAGGALGVLRFPDFYTRVHATNASDIPGGVLIIVGLALASGDGAIALRLILLAALFIAVGPTLAHLSASAGHAGGLAPLSGPHTAPRPGARPERRS
jgi:multicomponent Na+:H+ antiporter subunit G